MWYLYLDESGDLGFDFANKKPSNFFTVTVLVVRGVENNRALINAVKKTLKSKNKMQIQKFNAYLIKHLQGRIDPQIPLDIDHETSDQEFGLQAADMFSWGVFRKYESADREWFEVFKDKVRCDIEYP